MCADTAHFRVPILCVPFSSPICLINAACFLSTGARNVFINHMAHSKPHFIIISLIETNSQKPVEIATKSLAGRHSRKRVFRCVRALVLRPCSVHRAWICVIHTLFVRSQLFVRHTRLHCIAIVKLKIIIVNLMSSGKTSHSIAIGRM